MDVAGFLTEVCALPGVSGLEGQAAACIERAFRKYTDDVFTDTLGNVYAVLGEGGPTVLSCAHMDEVGLMATGFDERGGIYITAMGGVDPRILPGSCVTVHGKETLFGVIGVKPPHLTAGAQKAPEMTKLTVDVGLPKERVQALVEVGDVIAFVAEPRTLANERFALKTMDDRACIASMLVAMERLSRVKLHCKAIFCATVAEEIGSFGATVAGYRTEPDMAIAFDVTHGHCPGVESHRTLPLDTVSVGRGPLLHPAIDSRLREVAKAGNIGVTEEINASRTHTDADALQVARDGIPCGLISIPLSYMHTTVETLSLRTVEEAGRLLAGFIEGVDDRWEEWLCFKDC